MAWKKIDDYSAARDMPWSSFLADGLARNINSYPTELRRGGCITYRADQLPTWASYSDPQGTVIVVQCGQNATQVKFTVGYNTVTGNGPITGTLTATHLTTQVATVVDVTPSVYPALGTVDVTVNLQAGRVSGPQAFLIAFQSKVLENLGTVDIYGGTQNELYLHHRNVSAYTVTTGKKYEVIDVSTSNNGVMDAAEGRKLYQIGYVNTAVHPGNAEGTAMIWPELETVPQAVVNYYDNGKGHYGTVYELGALNLYFIQYEVTSASDGNQIRRLSHDLAYSPQSMNNAFNIAQGDFRPEVANVCSQENRLGRLLTTGGQVTAPFCVQYDFTGTVNVSFHCIRIGTNRGNIDFTLALLDDTGTVVATTTASDLNVGRMRYASTYTADANQFRALAGITSSPLEWGMIDSIPLVDALKGTPVRLALDPYAFTAVTAAPSGVYTLRLTADVDCFIFGFYASVD
jgi:hypothetical protein